MYGPAPERDDTGRATVTRHPVGGAHEGTSPPELVSSAHAGDFDTIYEARKGRARALRDRLTRGTVVERLSFVEELTRSRAPGRVLDVGCGAGRLCVLLARRGWEATGLDFVPEMVAELEGADAVVALTDHDAFDYKAVAAHARFVFDTRRRVVGEQVEYL